MARQLVIRPKGASGVRIGTTVVGSLSSSLTGPTISATGAATTGGEPADVVFHSDWSTALGSTPNAYLDQGKAVPWEGTVGSGVPEVVASTGLDFPTTNVLRAPGIDNRDPPQYPAVNIQAHSLQRRFVDPDVVTLGADVTSLFIRVYMRFVLPDVDGDMDWPGYHPIGQDWPRYPGTSSMGCLFHVLGNGTVRPIIRFYALPSADTRWDLKFALNKNQTYRYEIHRNFINTTEMKGYIRIFDSADQLVADEDSWYCVNDPSKQSLLDQVPCPFGKMQSGTLFSGNGPGGWPILAERTVVYWGGFCVSTSNWCGPYRGGK